MNYFHPIKMGLLTSAFCLFAGGLLAETHAIPADNTAKNERDVKAGPLTPEDQSNTQADVQLTADIRMALVDDSSLSVNAKNIKIITVKGVVTLRGPVNNQTEKDRIVMKAEQIAGAKNVINQLEVK